MYSILIIVYKSHGVLMRSTIETKQAIKELIKDPSIKDTFAFETFNSYIKSVESDLSDTVFSLVTGNFLSDTILEEIDEYEEKIEYHLILTLEYEIKKVVKICELLGGIDHLSIKDQKRVTKVLRFNQNFTNYNYTLFELWRILDKGELILDQLYVKATSQVTADAYTDEDYAQAESLLLRYSKDLALIKKVSNFMIRKYRAVDLDILVYLLNRTKKLSNEIHACPIFLPSPTDPILNLLASFLEKVTVDLEITAMLNS